MPLVRLPDRSAHGHGGVLFADAKCAVLAVSNSSFAFNSANGAGALAFLDGWAAKTAGQAPPCVDCSIANNTALLWGASTLAATNLQSVVATPNRRSVSSGGRFKVLVVLADGFGTTVQNALPGVTFKAACANCTTGSAALDGALSGKYDVNATLDGLSFIAPQNVYTLSVSVEGEGDFLNTTISTNVSMTVADCSVTETYDSISRKCVCIPNSVSNQIGDCECSSGTHAFFANDGTGARAESAGALATGAVDRLCGLIVFSDR